MTTFRSPLLMAAAIVLASAAAAFAQTTFTDPNVEYTFTIPSDTWRMTAKPSPTNPKVEFVYGDRQNGYFQVRKLTVPKDAVLGEIIRDEEQKLAFQQGFVAGHEESISGKLRGTIFNYEYIATARTFAGRFYFLRSNETTVYVLRFTGEKDSIRVIRPQTDTIARTFGVAN